MVQSAIVENIGTKGDLSVRPEGEEEAESSEGKDPETLSEIGEADQPISYILHFANVIKLYQKENQNGFGCGSPDHLVKDFQRISARSPEK